MNGLVDIIDRYGSIDDMPKQEIPEITLSEEDQKKLLDKLEAARDGNVDVAWDDGSSINDKEDVIPADSSMTRIQYLKAKRKKADTEIERYLIRLTELAMSIDDNLIAESKAFNKFERLYIFYLKYGDSLFVDGTMKKGIFSYNGVQILNANKMGFFRIESVIYDKEAGTLTFEGDCKLDSLSMMIGVNASVINVGTNDSTKMEDSPDRHDYALKFTDYSGADVRGFASEPFITGQGFSVTVKIRMNSEIRFMAEMVNSEKVNLKVYTGEGAGFGSDSLRGYRDFGDFLLRQRNTIIYVEPSTPENIRAAEELYVKDKIKLMGDGFKELRAKEHELYELASTGDIEDRTLFVSTRGDKLTGGINKLYEILDGEKTVFACPEPWDEETNKKAIELIYHSKTVVMDSPVSILKKYNKRDGQRFIQLWHGIAAFRMICGDEPQVLPCIDALYHRDYDMLTVSSYRMKDIYSSAMRVDPSRIAVTGSPDSDLFFEKENIDSAKDRIYKAHPELKGKQIFLYVPAAAERNEEKNAITRKFGVNSWSLDEGLNPYPPDYSSISEKLEGNQVFAVCPDTDYRSGSGSGVFIPRDEALEKGFASRFIPKGDYGNVISLSDFTPEEAVAVSDVVISDYSPIVYAAVLEDKPVSFYCPDGGSQGSVTYIDYGNELPGELFEKQGELENFISIGKYAVSVRQNAFKKKFLEKADGDACRRIADLLESGEELDFTEDVCHENDAELFAEENDENNDERD